MATSKRLSQTKPPATRPNLPLNIALSLTPMLASVASRRPTLKTESAILAGGCFWGVEDLLRKLPGVLDTEVGYTGGTTQGPTYETVKTGKTGHAEAIDISYDPAIITLDKL